MTSQQKAQALFDKYFLLTSHAMDEKYGWVAVALNKSLTKQCAIVAVDELIEEQEKYNNGTFYPSNYWDEVKAEIEKL